MDIDTRKIIIVTRDINGKRRTHEFRGVYEIMNKANQIINDFDEEEILLVTWGSYCIFSQLQNGNITVEDMIGFFA